MRWCSREANDVPSNPNEVWQYNPDDGHIRHKLYGRCLTTRGINIGDDVIAVQCQDDDPHQVWRFEHWRNEPGYNVTFPTPVVMLQPSS